MSTLVTGVTALVRAEAPDHSNRWSDAFIKSCIFMADSSIREEANVEWASYEFSMISGVTYYTLPSGVIGVRSVEFSRDSGVTYDRWLYPVTLLELDDISWTWQKDSGASPEFFFLLSAPGATEFSRIGIWRPVTTASTQKVRVNYTKCLNSETDLNAVSMPDEIQQEVYLPMVMALLMAHVSAEEASMYLAKYNRKIGWARARFSHNMAEDPYSPGC